MNLSSSDNSGMLRFLTDELQDAEDAGERGMYCFAYLFVIFRKGECCESSYDFQPSAWILGHVPAGWDGTNALKNPSNLCVYIHLYFLDTIR